MVHGPRTRRTWSEPLRRRSHRMWRSTSSRVCAISRRWWDSTTNTQWTTTLLSHTSLTRSQLQRSSLMMRPHDRKLSTPILTQNRSSRMATCLPTMRKASTFSSPHPTSRSPTGTPRVGTTAVLAWRAPILLWATPSYRSPPIPPWGGVTISIRKSCHLTPHPTTPSPPTAPSTPSLTLSYMSWRSVADPGNRTCWKTSSPQMCAPTITLPVSGTTATPRACTRASTRLPHLTPIAQLCPPSSQPGTPIARSRIPSRASRSKCMGLADPSSWSRRCGAWTPWDVRCSNLMVPSKLVCLFLIGYKDAHYHLNLMTLSWPHHYNR